MKNHEIFIHITVCITPLTVQYYTQLNSELRPVKELRHYFEKVSGEMDNVLQRSSGMSRSRHQDTQDMSNLVIATRRAFRHTAVDYVHALSVAQGKKRHEVVDAVSINGPELLILAVSLPVFISDALHAHSNSTYQQRSKISCDTSEFSSEKLPIPHKVTSWYNSKIL